ncbi:type IV secretory system conjugative DNA transfer family protein [Bacteroides thetaiotaomicron]|nr:type IV secretory system conjugative DNA transfer family protein [Bacteroides thetaiotaomicron]MBU9076113.1 type IV secretory system conjugative DNA transfer family protein [Bacteroides thetaiotaomicron]
MLSIDASSGVCAVLYTTTLVVGFFCLLASGLWISRLLKNNLLEDVFNTENESFMQETRLMENEYSINLPTKFWYRRKEWKGWINVVNPFRASMILGTPGSGKSYAVVNNYIKQAIEKSYALYIYDFKFDDLSVIAYNHLIKYRHRYKIPPKFYVINFDNPRKSHRCNPLAPELMTDISDAYESSYTIMLNLNKSWVQKQGDFFVESPIVLFTAIIWFLKIYEGGRFCTFPHAIELLNKRYEDVFTILTSYPELENYLSPFIDAWKGGASEQLQGQIASAKIPLSRLISPQLYWVMSGSDFTLDINNPKEPKVLCVGNNPDRISIYGAALGLYNSRIVKLINKKKQLKSCVIIDELPTIFFKGLDNLIATARSNKVAVVLGFQDFSQLKRDYGDKEAAVIMSTVGNVFSGQVVGETAKTLSERFGKILQKRESVSINRSDTSTSISTQLDSLIPASKISTLSQGMFVGAVADNFGEAIDQKIFHAQIVMDNEAVQKETAAYQPIPEISSFLDEEGNDTMEQQIQTNYRQIKQNIVELVENELIRIENDPALKHLLSGNEGEQT